MQTLSERKRPADEILVERIQLAVEYRADWLLIRRRHPQWHVTRGPVGRNLTGVDFVRDVAVNYVVRPNCRAKRYVRGIASADAGDKPVRLREVESPVDWPFQRA